MRSSTVSLVALFCGGSLGLAPLGNTVADTRAVGGNSLARYAEDDCSARSQSPTHWVIDDLVLRVYDWDNGGTTGTFGFRSYYSATNTTVQCMVQDVDLAKLAEGPWLKCDEAGTEFKFDFTEISLAVKETWTCPGSPGTLFSASSSGLIMLHGCQDNETEKGIESDCYLMEFEMAANVTATALAS